MKKLFILFFCVAVLPALATGSAMAAAEPAGTEPAGQVVDFRGDVFITPKGGASKTAALKLPVEVGATIETKANGSVKILFVDDTVLTLKENSKTLVTEFLFDAKAKKRKSIFNVLAGKVRTTVGRFFGNDQMVEIKTPTAVAGIRGTDVGALVEKRKTKFYCFDGEFLSYNVDFPDKVVKVKEGFELEIMKGVPASPANLAPIPPDVQKESFDISLSLKPEIKEEVESAGQQVVSSVSQVISVETAAISAAAAAGKATTSEESAVGSAATAQSQETTTSNSAPSDSTTSGTATLPGGSTESTTTTTNKTEITITFP